MKLAIKRNPDIGKADVDGNFIYQDKRFILKYRVINSNNEFKRAELISIRRRLENFEIQFAKFKERFRNFWVYREWEIFFRPKMLFSLLLPLMIFYFALFEPEADKIYMLRWIISRVAKVNIDNVTVQRGGWIKISGSRSTAVDRQAESISYNVNLFKWLTFQDDGYINRDRGGQYGYVTYPVQLDEKRGIRIKKEGKWIEGRRDADIIEWKEAQGTGIRSGKVRAEELAPENESSILDK